MQRIVIKDGTIVTLGSKNRVLKDHVLILLNDKVEKIIESKDLDHFVQNLSERERELIDQIDAQGKVVLPGFINAHHHFYSSFAKGLNKIEKSSNFHDVLNNLWWKLDQKLTLEDCHYSALVSSIEAIKKGTTTIIDHHSSPNAIKGSLKEVAKAVLESGIRANLCYEVSDRNGLDQAYEGIEENLDFFNDCKSKENRYSHRLSALFGMHASFTIGESTLDKIIAHTHKLDKSIGYHLHVAEDLIDQQITQKLHLLSVLERLYGAGILGHKTLCSHCVHLDDKEIELLKDTDSIVIFNPQSNMNNAVGVAEITKMLDKGILVGLGTDAMTCNMLEELRSSIWLTKLQQKDPSCFFKDAINILLKNNAAIANRLWDDKISLGEISEGASADIVLFKYNPYTEFDINTFYGHLVFGLSQGSVDTTIVAGKVLMRDQKLTILDEDQITSESIKLSKKLWKRMEHF